MFHAIFRFQLRRERVRVGLDLGTRSRLRERKEMLSQSHLKPTISLLLRPVCHKLEDGGGVVAGVVLLAVGEVDAGDELPVDDLVLLNTVHLDQSSVDCSIQR